MAEETSGVDMGPPSAGTILHSRSNACNLVHVLTCVKGRAPARRSAGDADRPAQLLLQADEGVFHRLLAGVVDLVGLGVEGRAALQDATQVVHRLAVAAHRP